MRHRDVIVVYAQPRPVVWPIVLALAVVIWLWKVLLIVAAAAVLAAFLWLAVRWWRAGVDAQMRIHEGLRQRADDQDAALHRGEEYGVYGQHPPADL